MRKQLRSAQGALLITVAVAACGALIAWASSGNTQQTPYECETPNYNPRIVSYDPLIIHLENFITPLERGHLLDLAYGTPFCSEEAFLSKRPLLKHTFSSPHLRRSTVEFQNGSVQDTHLRTSSTAKLNDTDDDSIVQCLVSRIAEFQGHVPTSQVQTLQVTTYKPGQYYGAHLDSLGNTSKLQSDRWGRTTTGFGILDATCEKCGTQFPSIKTDWNVARGDQWCRILDCEEKSLTVKPLPGSLLFWWNLEADGAPDLRTIHRGMPVTAGTKSGVNIWTRISPSESFVRALKFSSAGP
jgi:prolyl 4-hydroxylase